jgi:hypothetical protein
VIPCGGSFAQNLDDIRRAEDLLQFAANSGADVAEVAGRATNMRKFLERAHELALEPSFGKVRIAEGVGGARLEMHLGRKIERYNPGPEVPLETVKRTDFFDPTLGRVELKGPILNRDGFKIDITDKMMKKFTDSVLNEAKDVVNDVVYVDTLHMSQKQIDALKEAIELAKKKGEVKIPIQTFP